MEVVVDGAAVVVFVFVVVGVGVVVVLCAVSCEGLMSEVTSEDSKGEAFLASLPARLRLTGFILVYEECV